MKKKYSLIIIGIILIVILGICAAIFRNRTATISNTEAEALMQDYFIQTNQWDNNYVLQALEPVKGKVGSDEVYRFELRYKDSAPDVEGRLIGNYLITVDGKTIFWYDPANDEYVIQQSLDN